MLLEVGSGEIVVVVSWGLTQVGESLPSSARHPNYPCITQTYAPNKPNIPKVWPETHREGAPPDALLVEPERDAERAHLVLE